FDRESVSPPRTESPRLGSADGRFMFAVDQAETSVAIGDRVPTWVPSTSALDGRIFATLASEAQGYGNLALTPAEQKVFVEELPEVFVPVAGGWGRMGMTHIVLAKASEDVLRGALQTAWRLRVEKNTRTKGAVRTPGNV